MSNTGKRKNSNSDTEADDRNISHNSLQQKQIRTGYDIQSNDENEINNAEVFEGRSMKEVSESENEDCSDGNSVRKVPQGSDGSDESDGSDGGDTEEGSSSSDELDAIPAEKVNGEDVGKEINREVVTETRNFLRQNGSMAFLERYLPINTSSRDILNIILKLGFLPKDVPPEIEEKNEEQLFSLLQLLNTAMKKVITMRPRLANFCTIDHVIDKIKKANKIMVITGAGISTSLGIPDFRSSTGIYSHLESLGLNDPQDVFDLDFFLTEPNIFYLIAHMILPSSEKDYTSMHSFVKLLQDKGKLLRNYTQNIDNIESNAGIDKDKIVQCHGSFASASCVTCNYKVDGKNIFPHIKQREIPLCPKCLSMKKKLSENEDTFVPESYGVMKPDITFFGESLQTNFHDHIRHDIFDCDLVLCVGSSLKVAPVADIVNKVPEEVPQVLINKDDIVHANFDVSLLGYCDDIASYLSDVLGEEWRLPHPDFELRSGQNGKGLHLYTINENDGKYAIVSKTTS